MMEFHIAVKINDLELYNMDKNHKYNVKQRKKQDAERFIE
jgi:hypothetical protein